jgi:hypothetical protein
MMTHEAIEKNVAWDRIERPYVESAFAALSLKDRRKVKRAVSDEDVSFVRNGVRHYWDMRTEIPMLLLAREVRVVNLTAGYAGTFDALAWLMGTVEHGFFRMATTAQMADARLVRNPTLTDIQRIGGTLALLDWKTGKDLHTDQVVQAHAYLSAEFAVIAGKRDERITALLNKAQFGGLAHIRPNGWGLHLFPYEPEAVRAFLGSVAFARFLAAHPEPTSMFTATLRGASNETDEEVT